MDTKPNEENAKTKKKIDQKAPRGIIFNFKCYPGFSRNNSATCSILSSSFFITHASVFRARDQQGNLKF